MGTDNAAFRAPGMLDVGGCVPHHPGPGASDRPLSGSGPGDTPSSGRLVDRFGADVLAAGFTVTPNLLLLHAARLGITTGELLLVQYVFHHWRDARKPCPSVAALARAMGKSERMVRYYLHSLQAKGLLVLEQQFDGEGGQRSNRFDFDPLLRAVAAMERADATRVGADQRSVCAGSQLQPREESGCRGGLQSLSAIIEGPQHIEKDCIDLDADQTTNRECAADTSLRSWAAPTVRSVPVEAAEAISIPGHDTASPSRSVMRDPAYLVLLDPISLLGREFGDEAHPRVSTRRAYNLFLGSRLPIGSFLALLHEAAGRTRASRSAITTYRTGDALRQKNLVPFLFATLERLIQEQQISQYSSGVTTRGSPTRRDPQSSQTSNYCEAPSRLAAGTRDADDMDPLWHRVLNELAAVVVPSVFETWLAPTRSLGREGCCLRVEVPSVFHRQWLAARMSRQVESALTLLGHVGMKVVFVERKN